jgi:hypothetical protein
MNRWALAGAVALLLSSVAVETYASCASYNAPPCAAYWTADAVFTGTVAEIAYSEKFTLGEGNDAFDYRRRITRFAVKDAYRGVSGQFAEVVALEALPTPVVLPNGQQGVKYQGCDCTSKFEVGEVYLVYAHRRADLDNALNADGGRTRPVSDADEDLEYIRGLTRADGGAFVYGVVQKHDRVSDDADVTEDPVANATVLIEGMGRQVTATTDAEGRYRVSALSPGEYTVRFVVPAHLRQDTEVHRVTVVDRGCAEVGFYTQTDGRLRGRVVDADGKPVFEMKLDLAAEDRRDASSPSPLSAYTDRDGRYEFTDLAPGRYVLGVGLDAIRSEGFAYARIFYPGTPDPAKATVITVEEGQKLANYTLKLPKPLAERILEGVVVLADGSPARGAHVGTTMLEYPFDVQGPGAMADEQGRFTVAVFEGLAYCVGALVEDQADGHQQHAKPVDVASTGNVSGIKLVIAYPGGHGRSDRQQERSARQSQEHRERQRTGGQ